MRTGVYTQNVKIAIPTFGYQKQSTSPKSYNLTDCVHDTKSANGTVSMGIMDNKKTYILDGSEFSSLEEFAQHFSNVVLPDYRWNGNLEAFNDILRGGFGTPPEGFVIRWTNSDLSRQQLGYPETIRQLKKRLSNCHPTNREHFARELEAANRHEGATVFDWLIEIIKAHCPGGSAAEDGVELILE